MRAINHHAKKSIAYSIALTMLVNSAFEIIFVTER